MTQEKNQLKKKAEDFLIKNRIVELFEDLTTSLCYHQPQDIKEFLVGQLKQRQQQKQKEKEQQQSGFSQEQLVNVFQLFDLQKTSRLHSNQCKEALKILTSSRVTTQQIDTLDIPPLVDQQQFLQIYQQALQLQSPHL